MELIDPFCIQTEQNIDLWLPKSNLKCIFYLKINMQKVESSEKK